MGITNATERRVYSQPPTKDLYTRRQAAQQMDKLLMLLNVVERLPILSKEILTDTKAPRPFYLRIFYRKTDEILVKKVQGLHDNIVEMAELATDSKYLPLKLCSTKWKLNHEE